MPLPVCACLSACQCVCASMCECRRSHPQHTNVINKVKLLLGRERKEVDEARAHRQKSTNTNTKHHKLND